MFNTYNADNSSSTKINAVSGTIVKSHIKSWFKRFHINSKYADQVLDENATIVILQVMLACDGWVIAEIIKKEDLEEE